MSPTREESVRRDEVLARILDSIRADERIKLPKLGERSEFAGSVGAFTYQIGGEDDLLHLAVRKVDGSNLTPEEARTVASFVFGPVPQGVIWLKPGLTSQHFYIGQDELLST